MKNTRSLLLILFVAFGLQAAAQQLNGVYVGAELYTTPFDGMQLNQLVFYFRNDGTFTDKLDQKNWRSDVGGNYIVKNGFVDMKFKNEPRTLRYSLNRDGSLGSTAGVKHALHKVKRISSLPRSSYEKRSASSTGGMGTAMPNVFTSSTDFLYFDGKGKFTSDRNSVTSIGGDVNGGTIGGKFENGKNAVSGSYKLEDGNITFTFGNGKVSKHSFFYSPPDEEDLILLDGEFYFRQESADAESEGQKITAMKKGENALKETRASRAHDVMLKVRANYGGPNIDKIKTMREVAQVGSNLKAIAVTDVINKKIRAEVWQNNKLLLVKQLEGNEGWQWMKGKSKPLSQNEKNELKLGFYQGVLGLHNKLNSNFINGTLEDSHGDYMLSFNIDGNKVIYLIGENYELKGNGCSVNGKESYTVYRNFSNTSGVKFPLTTESSDGKNKIVLNTTSIEVNPSLTQDAWKMP
ncbi:hypothetical protein [Desertivirga arenae]|uniref:hypothetical protein n=1 Tax=Desertivirga arenae TaxID=2810309 RepID=UPI001A96E1FE|nr:hypothetical protein [Pedobacter sp. SYSU D00823]